jgi:hypothetical protein
MAGSHTDCRTRPATDVQDAARCILGTIGYSSSCSR